MDMEGAWAEIKDMSTRGISFDAGVCFMPGSGIFASAGIDVTGFRFTDIEISVGILF